MEGLIGLVAGTGWAAGINLYGVTALLGILGRVGLADVPAVLERTDVIAIAGALYLVEFVVDKIPYVDNAWDAVHTAIRPVGAAALGLLLTGEAETWQQALSAAGAGGLALASHAAKATARAAINVSPEPVSNSVASVTEDGLAAAVVWLAVTNPLLAVAVVLVLLVAGVALIVVLLGAARRGLARRRERRRGLSRSV